jgi:hypothetical protein
MLYTPVSERQTEFSNRSELILSLRLNKDILSGCLAWEGGCQSGLRRSLGFDWEWAEARCSRVRWLGRFIRTRLCESMANGGNL